MSREPPVLDAYRGVTRSLVYVFCPNCLGWHSQAGGDMKTDTWAFGDGDGRRCTHCFSTRDKMAMPSIRETGYILREVGPITDEVVRSYKLPPWGRQHQAPDQVSLEDG